MKQFPHLSFKIKEEDNLGPAINTLNIKVEDIKLNASNSIISLIEMTKPFGKAVITFYFTHEFKENNENG